jgi:ATP-dependent Clp protease adaptor protein ClpS
MRRSILPICTFLIALVPFALAQQDAPPPDVAQILQALKALREQQAQQVKQSKGKLLQDVQAAAASPTAASAAWVEAVRQTQFEGAEREGAQFRDWRDRDGAALSEPQVQRAAQLYFRWLGLTLQRSAGTPARDMLSQVVQYTKDAAADEAAMEEFGERAQKEKDLAQSKLHGNRKDKSGDDDRTKRVHDQILGRPLTGSPPVKAMRADEMIKVEGWEMTPGNVAGIFKATILPELRAMKDPRVLEYWDMQLKKEAEAVKNKPTFDQERFARDRRPILLWSRAQEFMHLGQKNRAVGEMFQVIRTNPQHPNLVGWISEMEQLLAPPVAAPTGACIGGWNSRHAAVESSGMPETVVVQEPESETLLDLPWNVVVHNDPVNLMSYVTRVFQKVFGYSKQRAERHMMEVHQKGRSIVWTGLRERAETYVQQLHGFHLLATIEKTET